MKLTETITEQYEHVERNVELKLEKGIAHSPTIEKMMITCEKWLDEVTNSFFTGMITSEGVSRSYCREVITKNLSYSQEDITAFCSRLGEFDTKEMPEWGGIFLTMLVTEHYKKTKSEMPYIIITAHLEKMLDFLGENNNGADIFIDGNCGDYAGYEMSYGTIKIRGNANHFLGGRMNGGKLSLDGNAGSDAGFSIKKGEIHIQGECECLGVGKRKSSKYVTWDYTHLHKNSKGKIFHKGMQVFPKIEDTKKREKSVTK